MKSHRVFVTGGHGFIGSAVVELLHQNGAQVLAPYHPSGLRRHLPAKSFELDLTDLNKASEAMRGVDTVIHLAAKSGGIRMQQVEHADVFTSNQRLTAVVLQSAASADVDRLFMASSAVVYRGGSSDVLHETSPLLVPSDRPSGYAWSKICDEVLGRWYGGSDRLDVVVGRFTSVYGPDDIGNPATVIDDLVARAIAAKGKKLTVWGEGTAVRSFIHRTDAAKAVLTIIASGESNCTYNIDTTEPVTIAELATTVRDLVDPIIEIEFDHSQPTGSAFRVLDSSRLRNLGFEPSHPLRSGLEEFVDHATNKPRLLNA